VTRIKVCGIVREEDARAAVAAGADALGFVFTASPRQADPDAVREIVRRLPPFVRTVGVFRDAPLAEVREVAARAAVDLVQLHGEEGPADCRAAGRPVIKRVPVHGGDTRAALAVRLSDYDVAAILVDPGAGSGVPFPWGLARGLPGNVILAGGLDAENVGRAIRDGRPYAVDVSSGVERAPGFKCPDRLRRFVAAVRSEDARSGT
jgi:phosphoribosylanthranilate isomerase